MIGVPPLDRYVALADWGARLEPPDDLTLRWIALIARLSALHPALQQWIHFDLEKGVVPFDPSFEAQMARVVEGMETSVRGEVVPAGGSSLHNTTRPFPRSRHVRVNMCAGMDAPWDGNGLIFDTASDVAPNPELVSYDVFRGATLAMAEAFETTQAFAYPQGLSVFWDPPTSGKGRPIPLAWISYVAPRFAHLVTPPSRAIVERRRDGGLLMAATDDTFRTENPTHLAVARDIEAALVPFNALPWTAETGK